MAPLTKQQTAQRLSAALTNVSKLQTQLECITATVADSLRERYGLSALLLASRASNEHLIVALQEKQNDIDGFVHEVASLKESISNVSVALKAGRTFDISGK
jgi:hypothetical protein